MASLGMCLGLQSFKPTATFYLLPTRGWELGSGSMIALMPGLMLRLQPVLAALFTAAGGGGAGGDPGVPHRPAAPGARCAAGVLATAVVIARRHPLLERALVSRALARVGDVSYSLYGPLAALRLPQERVGLHRDAAPEPADPDGRDRPRAAALPLRRDADPPLAAAFVPALRAQVRGPITGAVGVR